MYVIGAIVIWFVCVALICAVLIRRDRRGAQIEAECAALAREIESRKRRHAERRSLTQRMVALRTQQLRSERS